MKLAALGIVAILLGTTFLIFNAPLVADAASLTTFTTPQSITFAQTFTTRLHVDIPPSPFTFYPNGTVKLVNTGTVYMKWAFAIIPLQTPTSFQANSTYVVYNAIGPATCRVAVSFKQGSQSLQQGNQAIFGMSGTGCASSTFSINLKNFGAPILTFNSTGGSSGTICQVTVGSIDWNWCVSALASVTVSYSAGTIQVKNTATSFSWVDPIAVDASGKCTITTSVTTCSAGTTTVGANELLIVVCAINVAGAGSKHCTTPTATGLTFAFRTSVQRASNINTTEWWVITASSFSNTISCNVSASGNSAACLGIAISGEDTVTTFDTNAAIPATASGGNNNKPTVTTVSTNNANDMLLGLTGDQGTVLQTGGTCAASTCTLIIAANGGPSGAAEDLVVSATQTSATVAFGTNTGVGNGWAMIADAIRQGGVNTIFTLSETISVTPSIKAINMKSLADTLSITPAIQKIGKELVSATVSITPSIQKVGKELVSATLSITPAIQKLGKELVSATVSITPSIQKLSKALVSAAISISSAVACILNGADCPSAGGVNLGDPVPYLWLMLIPLFMIIVMVVRKKL